MKESSGTHIIWLIFPKGATIRALSETLNKHFTNGWFGELDHGSRDGSVAIRMQVHEDRIPDAEKAMREAGGSVGHKQRPW